MRLYNVIFPLFLLIWFSPITILIAIVLNFIIDSLVLYLSLKRYNLASKENMKHYILQIYGIGFLCDFIFSLITILLPMFFPSSIIDLVNKAIMWNPFSSLVGFIYICLMIAACGVTIYFLNKKLTFRKQLLPQVCIKTICLNLAIFTAPYLFLFPSQLIY